jgi:DNA-binding NarL/FixJ family response regulator
MMPYRIFIVEDHPKMRETYALLINTVPELEVCGIVATGAEALAAIQGQLPDLVIVDISLPDTNGIALTQQLRACYPALCILVVSGHQAENFATHVERAGAHGYVDKHQAYRLLIPTIREILEGRVMGSEQ